MALEAGARLGPYAIASRLGAGGMGEVYRATDTRLDRSVAIKILPAELAAEPAFRARFDREARTISQLNHPHICACRCSFSPRLTLVRYGKDNVSYAYLDAH